jgi:hypothetical protein
MAFDAIARFIKPRLNLMVVVEESKTPAGADLSSPSF